jgi:hypothetical protein
MRIIQQSDLKTRLEGQRFRVVGNTPEQFSQFYLSDIEKNGKVLKAMKANK